MSQTSNQMMKPVNLYVSKCFCLTRNEEFRYHVGRTCKSVILTSVIRQTTMTDCDSSGCGHVQGAAK